MAQPRTGPKLAAYLLSSAIGGAMFAHTALAQAPGAAPPAPETIAPATTSPSAVASTAPPAKDQDLIVVTGSALPTTPDAVVVPVSIVNAEAIAKGGVQNNVLEILRKQVPLFAGRSNAGNANANNTNQNTAGGSQIQIRNLDTLVLVDGRRVAVNAIAGLGGKVFVDASQFPAGAIERLEVLTDGASATYGSDAIGGVVNVILKKKYEGLAGNVRDGFATGNYDEFQASLLGGTNIGKRANLTLSASYTRSNPLYQDRRPFSSPFFSTGTAVPGAVGTNYLNPTLTSPSQTNPTGVNATAPNIAALQANGTYTDLGKSTSVNGVPQVGTGIGGTYDLSREQTLLLGQELKAVSGAFNYDILDSGNLELFVDSQYADNGSNTRFRPVVSGITVPRNAPFNPVAGPLGVTFGFPADTKNYDTRSESFRVDAGLRGKLRFLGPRWTWEVAYVHSSDKLNQYQRNVIFKPNLAAAIAGGYDATGNPLVGGGYSKVLGTADIHAATVLVPALDPFSRNANQPALRYVYATQPIQALSTLDSVDGAITGTLPGLPAGRIGISVGAAYREEALSGNTDANGSVHGPSAGNYIGGQNADPFSHSRNITSEYGEARVPITSRDWNVTGLYALDLIAAVRHERYSDAGNSTVPKIGFRWQPLSSQVTIRGAYARSFTAPTLYAEYGPTNNRLAGPGIIPAAFPGLPAGLSPVQDGNNPKLGPSKARSFSLGVVLKPDFAPRLHVDLEYSNVYQTGQAAGIGFSNIFLDVNQKGSASPFAGNIAQGNYPGQPGATPFVNPGDLRAYLAANPANYNNVYAIDRFTNLAGIKSQTMNWTIAYTLPTARLGTFSLDSTQAYFLTYKYKALPTQKYYEYAGTATNGGTGVQGSLPRYRAYTALDWNYQHFDVTVANTYVSPVTDLGAGGVTFETNSGKTPPTAFAGHIKSYMSWDLRVALRPGPVDQKDRGFEVAFGINNVFDRQPPVSSNVGTPSAAFSDVNADISTYSPIGRLFYASAGFRY